MRRASRIVLMLCVLGIAVWVQGRPESEVGRLGPVVAELQSLRVSVWRDQDWCRCFAYPRGQFMQSSHESTCGLFQGKAIAFTPQATADFDRVRAAVASSRVKVLWATVRYRPDGSLEEAEFALDTLSRRSYVFHPGYGQLPPNQGAEMRYTAVNADWYIRDEDWN